MTSQSLTQFIDDHFVDQLLNSSGPVNVIQAGDLLYKSLRKIRKTEEKSKTAFSALRQLTPAVLHLTEGISTVIEQQESNKKRKKTLRLCLQLCRNACLGFYALHQCQDLSDEQKKMAVYLALQMVGLDILLRYRFQTPISSTLWKMSGKLYFFAIKHQYLEDTLSIKTPDFLPLKTINAVLKRNILLTLSTTELDDTSNWQTLFNFANHHADLIQLPSHQKQTVFFYWNTIGGFPTQLKNPQQNLLDQDILIDCHDLVEAIQNKQIRPNLTAHRQKRLFYHLTGYQKLINDVHPSPPIIFKLTTGLDSCIQQLTDIQKIKKIQQLSGIEQFNGNVTAPPDNHFYGLSLAPQDAEIGIIERPELPDYAPHSSHSLTKTQFPVKFLETDSDPDFFLLDGEGVTVNNGDFIILINNRNALLAGIVRQQKNLPNFRIQRLLIEKIHGELSAYPYQKDSEHTTLAYAIILNENSKQAEIFLSDKSIKPGTTITLAHRPAQIGNLTGYTDSFLRFQIMLNP